MHNDPGDLVLLIALRPIAYHVKKCTIKLGLWKLGGVEGVKEMIIFVVGFCSSFWALRVHKTW